MNVYQAISAVSAELSKEGISKDRKNEQQHYKFRGIDDCLNALAPLLSKAQLVILPEVLEREVIERQTKSGGALFYVTVKVKYALICAEDGSRHDVTTYGEAMDSADKATNKAMSAAYKYAVIQAFCIPTEGDNDADATTHEVASRQQAIQRNKQTAQAKINELRQAAPEAPPSSGAVEGAGQGTACSQPAPSPYTDDPTTPYKLRLRDLDTAEKINKWRDTVPDALWQDLHDDYIAALKAVSMKKK